MQFKNGREIKALVKEVEQILMKDSIEQLKFYKINKINNWKKWYYFWLMGTAVIPIKAWNKFYIKEVIN